LVPQYLAALERRATGWTPGAKFNLAGMRRTSAAYLG